MAAGASTLLIDEYFAEGDDRFFDEVLRSRADRKLHALAPRWYEDERPWAREMLLRYVDDGCDREGHRGLVKVLFKRAEQAGDDLLMAHFLVAFDRLIEHKVRKRARWDWETRESFTEYRREQVTREPRRQPRDRKRARGRFSIYTRQYLQRRALRYFRHLGFRDPVRFGKASRAALLLYEDAHLERPEQIVDAWGLVHLLYYDSPVLVRHPRGVRVAEGSALSELDPAPMHPGVWVGCFDELTAMLAAARSLVVRRWLVAWLKKHYADELRAPDIRKIKRLLWSPHPDVQTFAAGLLERARGLETLPVVEWLALLDVDNPNALPIICDQVSRHVTPDRLDLAACVELACARPAPVAALGLRWARAKSVDDRSALTTALGLVEAKAPRVLEEAAGWLAELVARPSLGTREHVLALLDAKQLVARTAGLQLMAGEKRFADDVTLWAALAESPYHDVRSFLVRHLARRVDDLPEAGVERVWATTLLGVSSGSRTKRLVLRQLAERVVAQSERASELLPLLAVALRSVRETERRAALAAIARAAFVQPALRAPLAEHIPELVLFPEVSS